MLDATPPLAGNPLVSIVLLTYNRPLLLREALSSAIGQTYTNLEILVCDNASDPETAEALSEFSDPRIQHRRHETNLGMTANAKDGFLAARGKYLTNLHDDDFWDPTFIEKMVQALEENPTAVIAFSDHFIVNGSGEIQVPETEKNTAYFGRGDLAPGLHQPFQELGLINLSIPMAMATVLRREAIDWNDIPPLVCAYDLWLVYLACRDGQACYYLPERLTYYRVHAASESATGRIRLNQGFIEIYRGILQDDRLQRFHPIFKKRLGIHHVENAIVLLRQGDRKGARKMLISGIHYRFHLKPCLAYVYSYLPKTVSMRLPKRIRFSAITIGIATAFLEELHENTCYWH